LTRCPECGEEVSNEMKFCPKCGTALGGMHKGGIERPDTLGAISAGMILIIIAVTFIRYPIEPSIIVNYFENMADRGTFIKPPLILFDPIIFFFSAVGLWAIVLSGLRIILQRSERKAIGDLIGGVYSFFCAFLLTNYAADVFTWQRTLAYFIIAAGALVIINAITRFAFPKR